MEEASNCSCDLNITLYNQYNCTQICTEEYFSKETIITLHILYVIVLFVGVIGNILTCTVIILRPTMRRSIHYYTFNLSICDLAILFFYIPTQMVYVNHQLEWTMGLPMCKVSYVVIPVTLVGTIGTLLAITIDRARGLIQPFKWRSDSKRNAKLIIPAIWLTALVFNIPLFIYSTIEYDGGVPYCADGWPKPEYGTIFWLVMFVLVFAIPLVVIVVAHVVIFFVMLKDKSSIHRKHNIRMIRMVVALVVVFTVCTGFQHLVFFLVLAKVKFTVQSAAMLFGVQNFVVSFQAALNPIIYGTLRQDFKRAFGTIIMKLMIKVKLCKNQEENKFQRRILVPLSSSFRTIRSTIRSRDSSSRSGQMNADSPITSPRHSVAFDETKDEPRLLLIRTNSKDINVVKTALRKNIMTRYERTMSITSEKDMYDIITEQQRSDSPLGINTNMYGISENHRGDSPLGINRNMNDISENHHRDSPLGRNENVYEFSEHHLKENGDAYDLTDNSSRDSPEMKTENTHDSSEQKWGYSPPVRYRNIYDFSEQQRRPSLRSGNTYPERYLSDSTLETNDHVYDYSEHHLSDSPIPPTYVTAIAFKHKDFDFEYVNKRFSRIIEYLNDSKETIL